MTNEKKAILGFNVTNFRIILKYFHGLFSEWMPKNKWLLIDKLCILNKSQIKSFERVI